MKKAPTLCLLALSLLQTGPAFSDPTTPPAAAHGYRVRFWDLRSADSSEDSPSLKIWYDAENQAYTSKGTLTVGRKAIEAKLSYGQDKDGALAVEIADSQGNKWTHAYPSAQFKQTRFGDSGTQCELQAFTYGREYWLVEFDEPEAPDATRANCDAVVNYNFQEDISTGVDPKRAFTAEDRLLGLAYGDQRVHPAINNLLQVNIEAQTIHEGSVCKITPNKVSDAFLAQLPSEVESDAKTNPQELTARAPETQESDSQRFGRCNENFKQTFSSMNFEVVLVKGPNAFINPEGWPLPGKPNTDATVWDKPFEISCGMKTVLMMAPYASDYFINLRDSFAGRPMPGIAVDGKLPEMSSSTAENNAVHKANYRQASRHTLNPLKVFDPLKFVSVPRESYDRDCGDPIKQMEYASGFINDVTEGSATGQYVVGVTAGTVIAAGTAATFGTAPAAAAIGLAGTGVDAALLLGDGPQSEKEKMQVTVLHLTDPVPPPPPPKVKIPAVKAQGAGGHNQTQAQKAPPPPPAPKDTTPPPPTVKLNKPIISAMLKNQNTDKAPPGLGDPNSLKGMDLGAGKGGGVGNMAGLFSGSNPGPKVVVAGPPVPPSCDFSGVNPEYSEAGRTAKVSGSIHVMVHVGKDGSIASVDIASVDPALQNLGMEEKAREAVTTEAHCKAGSKSGAPASGRVPGTVTFSLSR